MTARRQPKVPRAPLICCEGNTEEQYFDILLDFHRPPAYVVVKVYGQEGQHMALVDNTVAMRNQLCAETGYDSSEMECWAVCDEDKMPCSYTELKKYADERCVRLAFSAPQFEMYLLRLPLLRQDLPRLEDTRGPEEMPSMWRMAHEAGQRS